MSALRSLIVRGRDSELVRHGLLVFVCLTGANIINYIFYAIIGRMVGVENYGVFNSVVAAVIICMTPATIGQTVVAKLAADFRAVEDHEGLRGFADAVTVGSMILGLALGLVGIAFAVPLANYLHIEDTSIVIIAALTLAAAIVTTLQRGIFQGGGAFGSFGVSNLFEALSKTAFAAAATLSYGVRGAFIGMTVGIIVTAAYNELRLRQRFRSATRRFRPDAYRIAVSASATGLGVFAITVMLLFDVILVKHYFGAREAGLYGAAALIGRALFTVVAFVPTLVLPKASGHRAAQRSSLTLLLAAGGVTIGCCATAIAVFKLDPAGVLILIAGKNFVDAAPLVFPYGCATAALATANVFAVYKIGMHRFGFVRPLLAVMCCEIISVVVRHHSLTDVLQTIVIGHTAALLVVVWRLNAVPQHIRIVEAAKASN